MAYELKTALAKQTYRTLLNAIEANGWTCSHNDAQLNLNFGVHGDDLDMEFYVLVDAEQQIVRLISRLPFKFPGDKIVDGAIATGIANYALIDGNFDLDIVRGDVLFRMTTGFQSSVVSKEVFINLVNYAAWAVDKFNDKLFMVSSGMMSVNDFIKFCQ